MSLPTFRFQDHDLIRLGTADDYLLLAPQYGGRLVRWVCRGNDVLYWPDSADWSRPAKIRGGNPLLFPFIGRHFVDGVPGQWRDGAGHVHALPQHGFARDSAFEVTAIEPGRSITMALRDSPQTRAGYPFAFEFEVTCRVLDDGLEVALRTTNTGTEPMPYYAGHHFYFAVPHGERPVSHLTLPAAERVRQQADGTLTVPEPGESTYILDDPRLQDTFHALHAQAPVTLDLPGKRLTLTLDVPGSVPWHAVTTWTEHADSDFYCVEPWLGLPDAIHNGQGLRWLAPGQGETAVCRLSVQPRP